MRIRIIRFRRFKHITRLLQFFIVLYYTNTYGQDPYYVQYDENNGLPSSEVYDIFQDNKGLIWLATDRGVCLNNGNGFNTYTNIHGLTSNTNFKLYQAPDEDIYTTNLWGEINNFRNDRFHLHPASDSSNNIKSPQGFITRLFILDSLFFYVPIKSYMPSRYNRKDILVEQCTAGTKLEAIAHDYLTGKSISYSLSVKNIISTDQVQIKFYGKNGREAIVGIDSLGIVPLTANRPNQGVYFANNAYLYYWDFKSRKVVKTLFFEDKKIINIYHDYKSDDLWVMTTTGVFRYTDGNLSNTPHHHFKSLNTTNMIRDREGNYWISTWDRGVFYVPSFDYMSLDIFERDRDCRILSLFSTENRFFYGSSNGSVGVLDLKLRLINRFTNSQAPKAPIEHFQSTTNRLSASYGLELEFNGSNIVQSSYSSIIPFAYQLSNDYILEDRYTDFSYIRKKDDKVTDVDWGRPYCALQKSLDTLWVGTSLGLWLIVNDSFHRATPVFKKYRFLQNRICDIKCSNNGKVTAFATRNHGLVLKIGNSFHNLNVDNGLASNQVNRVFFDGDSIVFACTNRGLTRFNLNSEDIKSITFSTFTTADGLLSNFINDITHWKGHYYIATNKGINRVAKSHMKANSTKPIINALYLYRGHSKISQDRPRFEMGNHIIELKYSAVCFRKPVQRDFYRYQLFMVDSKVENSWIYTNNESVQLYKLMPGNYVFELQARDKNGSWSNPKLLRFDIQPTFLQSVRFKLLIGFLLLLTLFLIYYFQLRKVQQNERNARQLAEFKLQALRAQINPHFMFNVLTSIQYFFTTHDERSANKYMNDFAYLVRKVLNSSGEKLISLEDELELLKKYIELELLRIAVPLEYEISIAKEINTERTYIPSMLLQPFVENALIHGIPFTREEKGRLNVLFDLQNEELHISIIDNGRGIENGPKNKRSKGIEITKERLDIMNRAYKMEIKLNIFNRAQLDPSEQGVTVKLTMKHHHE